MPLLGFRIAAAGAVGLVAATAVVPQAARAQGTAADPNLAVIKPGETGTQAGWRRKMAGSYAEVATYIGSGSFYASGFRNEYVAAALFARPTYDLGTRYKLSVNARIFLEEEFTQPDNPTGRRFNAYDLWLWLAAKEIHVFQRPKLRLGAVARTVLPLSYESRYSHMLTGLAVGPNISRVFEFGAGATAAQRWKLALSAATVFTKYFHTSDLRGNSPGDTTGCRAYTPAGAAGGAAGGAPTAASSDTCGGPVNTSYSFLTTFNSMLSRGKWSLAATLLVTNSFRYDVPIDPMASIYAADVGRSDSTWGILMLGYAITDHMGVSLGLSSFQPALDARNRYPRFPFFDLSGGANANNYTQAVVGLNGTL